MNKIEVVSLTKQIGGFKSVEKVAAKILKILKKNNVSVEIYLADAKKMRFLNKKFRCKNNAANILSFKEPSGFISPPSKARKIGEIYLNVSNIKHKASREILLTHGLLHLLGYKHGIKNDTIKMEKMEKFLISNI